MAVSLPNPVVRFVAGPALDHGKGSFVPPPKLGFGACCFRATSDIVLRRSAPSSPDPDTVPEVPGWSRIGAVVGYDSNPGIAKAVQDSCNVKVKAMGGRGTLQCTDPSLTMLKASPHMRCEGEVYFEHGGKTTRLL
jgi:hypothetical protein